MRTPGLWASMRGIYALRSFGEAEGDSSCIRGLRLMGLFVRHALRAGRSGSPTLQPAHTRDRGRARLGATTSHTRGASRTPAPKRCNACSVGHGGHMHLNMHI